MRTTIGATTLLLLAACDGGVIGLDDTGLSDTADTALSDVDTDSDTTGDTDTDTDTTSEGCTATVTSTSPVDDDINVPVTKVVSARFSTPIASDADWDLYVDGVSGTSTLASDGLSATFTADSDYAASSDYTAHVEACGQSQAIDFTTASGPLDSTILDGRTYFVDYDDITWVQPQGIGSLIGGFVDIHGFLIAVTDVDTSAETITASGSVAAEDPPDSGTTVQDPCTAPYDFGENDFSGNPVFEIGPTDMTFDAGGTQVGISNAFVHAVFIENGDAIGDIRISGQFDTAPLSASLGFDACSLLPCAACASTGAATCIDVMLTADRGAWQESLVFDPALDPTQNPSCN